MIKVIHLITGLSTGGAEMMLYKLISRMDRARFCNVVVSMTDKGTLGSRLEEIGVPVIILNMKRGIPDPKGIIKLMGILSKERPQILQTWLYHADFLGLLAAKITGVRAVLWNLRCSNMDLRHYSKLTGVLVHLLAKLSSFPDAVLVNSAAGMELHEKLGYRPRRWQLIPNGFELDRYRPDIKSGEVLRRELDVPEDSIFIGMVARYDPMKDHAGFLRAAGYLLKKYAADPEIHFIMVGKGIDYGNSDLTKIIQDAGIKKYVHLMGERHDIPGIMAAMDIYTSSSYGEGFPNVVGEAMACGVPCVVTDVGDSALIVDAAGLVVPPNNPLALAGAWRQLVEIGPEGRRRLGMAARCRIEEKYSLAAVVAQYEKLYMEFAGL